MKSISQPITVSRLKVRVLHLLLGASVATACASGPGAVEPAASSATSTGQAAIVESSGETELSRSPVEPSLNLLQLKVPVGEMAPYVFPALGGIRFEAVVSHGVYAYGDRVMVDPIGGIAAFDAATAYVGLATQDSDGGQIATIDDFFAELEGAAIQSTGSYIELFGFQLEGYSSELRGRNGFDPGLLSSSRRGSESRHTWTPNRDVFFVAETAAGVLYAGYDNGGSPDNPVALPAFGALVASAELTGPGLDLPLPAGSTPEATGPKPTPADVIKGGPEPLQVAFGEIFPGTYQLPNFGQQLSIELSGWRVQPNQPGIVVFSKANSAGPGDGVVVFLAGLNPSIVPLAGGPSAGGNPIDLSELSAFLDEPPGNLEISNQEVVQVGDLDAVRFDVRVASGQSCAQTEPCEFAFQTTWPWNFHVAIQAELEHRIWWFSDHPSGVAMIHASGRDSDFLSRASDLIATATALS